MCFVLSFRNFPIVRQLNRSSQERSVRCSSLYVIVSATHSNYSDALFVVSLFFDVDWWRHHWTNRRASRPQANKQQNTTRRNVVFVYTNEAFEWSHRVAVDSGRSTTRYRTARPGPTCMPATGSDPFDRDLVRPFRPRFVSVGCRPSCQPVISVAGRPSPDSENDRRADEREEILGHAIESRPQDRLVDSSRIDSLSIRLPLQPRNTTR